MNRTTSILGLAMAMGTSATFGAKPTGNAVAASTNNKRPNILYIMTDQQRWDALGYSGNKVIKTPNLDRLARSGAWFTQAVTQCPVSAPARCAILTGVCIEKSRVMLNEDALDKSLVVPYSTFDQVLAKNDYYTEYYGKFHSPRSMAEVYRNPPQEGFSGADLIINGDKVIYKKLLDERVPKRPLKEGEQYASGVYNGVPYTTNPMDQRYGHQPGADIRKIKTEPHGCVDLPPDLTFTAYTANAALKAMDRVAKNKPFVLSCSIVAPHPPTLSSEPYSSMYAAKDMPIPATIADDMANNPYRRANGRQPEFADPKRIGYFISDYYAMVSEVDLWVGKLLDKLDQLGLTQNTVVIFTSDHGEMLGDHGMQSKFIFLEGSVHVPLIISYPGVIKPGTIVDAPVSTFDIYPTLLNIVGIDSSQPDGYSLMPLTRGEKPKYDFAVSEWTASKPGVPNIMIRTKEWKLMLSYTDDTGKCDALFNMKADPGEMNNLLGTNPAKGEQKTVVAGLQKKLVDYLTAIKHPRADQVAKRVIVK